MVRFSTHLIAIIFGEDTPAPKYSGSRELGE